jgi:hypothetical protein
LVILRREALKKKILDEAHTLRYSIYPGSTKMYHDLRQQFWWTRIKRKKARYVSECDTCRKVKVDYMKPGGLLQPLNILDLKWDDINMNFIMGLPMTARKYDSIWVIVDWFTNWLILYLSTPAMMPRSMLRYMLLMCYACMEFRI